MQDPVPENIEGQKVHTFNHKINWGYVTVGVAAVLLGLVYVRHTKTQDDGMSRGEV